MSACNYLVSKIAGVEELWSNEEYSMSDFLAEHGQRIPMIICISEGYSGVDDMHSVSVEDVRANSSFFLVAITGPHKIITSSYFRKFML